MDTKLNKIHKWLFEQRGTLTRQLLDGESIDRRDVFIGFTRHTPTIITNGPKGLNGSVKGVGFIPNDDYIDEILDVYLKHIDSDYDNEYQNRGLKILWGYMWSKPEKFNVLRMGTIELAKRNTWDNLKVNKDATLLFYQPPMLSYEMRAEIIIHTSGKIHKYMNAQHDVYHKPNPALWDNRPVYEIIFKEIYDKSAGPNGFGKTIYP